MHDKWCRRLVLLAGLWIAAALALQLVIAFALR